MRYCPDSLLFFVRTSALPRGEKSIARALGGTRVIPNVRHFVRAHTSNHSQTLKKRSK